MVLIKDGSFCENAMFTYVSEYGSDRYNYELNYDALEVIVYYDSISNLYGFEFSAN